LNKNELDIEPSEEPSLDLDEILAFSMLLLMQNVRIQCDSEYFKVVDKAN
jgi:hypothetical protein